MISKNKVIVIIPARSGSKRLPGKNIKVINGKPMIAHAICAALKSKYVDRVIVSTDDEKIAKVARDYKAEIPFMRPEKLASDTATTLSVLKHCVNYLETKENYFPNMVVLIQPTSPFILTSDIDTAIEKLQKLHTNSCISVCRISDPPEWMYKFTDKNKNRVKPFIENNQNKKKEKVNGTL